LQPDVKVTYAPARKYWFVRFVCVDRNKLMFDIVCTFVDLDFDIFHATLDTEDAGGFLKATMEFYVRPRLGGPDYDAVKGRRLAEMLRAAILRRLPKGLKVHVQTHEVCAFDHVMNCAAADVTAVQSCGAFCVFSGTLMLG
jgi:hypothetical protein